MFIYTNDARKCGEQHIGNTPRSIMTQGMSVTTGTQYGNFIRGNKDKLMISYRREPSHDYSMQGTCGVLFEGEIHFFGGYYYGNDGNVSIDFLRQHFVIETDRSEQLVKMTKKEDLEIGFNKPSCSNFEITSEYFPWFQQVVVLCFGGYHAGFRSLAYGDYEKSCYSFDGKLTYMGDSKYEHYQGGLTKYKSNLLTVGGVLLDRGNQKTEIMKMNEDQNLNWSVVEPNFKFTRGKTIIGHSLVSVEPSDINEEFVLLIGGNIDGARSKALKNVFKFNGKWSYFGRLNKPRTDTSSIYWNGAVYVIGGNHKDWGRYNYQNTKMEIWNIKDSPDLFKTQENWPELFNWQWPHLFIVPDSFFPDH